MEIMLKETIESIELIKEEIGIENIIDALYTITLIVHDYVVLLL